MLLQHRTFRAIRKSCALGVLYFVQGLPYGLQDKLIPLLFISSGHSPASVTLIRLLMLPWLGKALFAPLIDTTLTTTKWVTISLVCLASICLYNCLLVPSNTVSTIPLQFIVTLFLLNLFSAIQDIAVDAIAINVLSNGDEVATGNAGQIVGYKLGALTGSTILFYTYSLGSWPGLFGSLASVYILVLLFFLTITRQTVTSKPIKLKTETETEDRKEIYNPTVPLLTISAYLFVYKLGESASMTTFPFFLHKSAGVSSHQIALWNGLIGVVCSIFGSLLASQFPPQSLRLAIKFRLLPLTLMIVASAITDHWPMFASNVTLYYANILSLVLLHFIGGVVTTITFTSMMITCQHMPESFRATRYTLLSSIEVFGKLLFASVSGLLVDHLGFSCSQLIFLLASLLPLWLIGPMITLKQKII